MSERPENPQDEQTSSTGGWHSPAEASPWQAPETQTVASVAWREVKALPENVDATPEKRGDWHLTDDEDTVFTSEDVVEITNEPRQQPTSSIASARPEDLIADILGQSRSSAPRPEDFVYPTGTVDDEEEETVAADLFEEGATLLVDEEDLSLLDDDDEAMSMSEYMALANLAQGDDDFSDIDSADLSPAERAVFNIARQVEDEMDTGREPPIEEGDTITMDDTSAQPANQAADYARQQLEALRPGIKAGITWRSNNMNWIINSRITRSCMKVLDRRWTAFRDL